MSSYIDRKYVSLLAPKLERFTQKNNYLWNFRCPVCNDSKKNKIKARGYIYLRKSNLFFICHNCHASMSLGNLIKSLDLHLFDQYKMEKFKEESHGNVPKPDFSILKEKPVFNTNKISLPTIELLNDNHTAKKYIMSRKIPKSFWSTLYYADDFLEFADKTFPGHGKNLPKEDPRIVIPFYDQKNILQGVQGRALGNSNVRYITLKTAEESIKIFGLDKLDFTKTIYVVEGPFDSMFLPNCIATMDANLSSVVDTLGAKHKYVFVFDNEPRNKDIVKQMSRAINKKLNICIWPSYITSKDVNDMVQNGISVKDIIDDNTYNELKAKLQLETWRKV